MVASALGKLAEKPTRTLQHPWAHVKFSIAVLKHKHALVYFCLFLIAFASLISPKLFLLVCFVVAQRGRQKGGVSDETVFDATSEVPESSPLMRVSREDVVAVDGKEVR